VHAVDDGLARGRDAHRTHHLAPVHDRHRDEQKILAGRVAEPAPGVDATLLESDTELRAFRGPELRPGRRFAGAVHEHLAARIRDDDALVRCGCRGAHRLGQCCVVGARAALARRDDVI
jgi:hypothetical protein